MKQIFFIAFLLGSIVLIQSVSAVQVWANSTGTKGYCCSWEPCREFSQSDYMAVGADDGVETYCDGNYPLYIIQFNTSIQKTSIEKIDITFEKRNGGNGIDVYTGNKTSLQWEYLNATPAQDGTYTFIIPNDFISNDGQIWIELSCGIQDCDFFMDFARLDITLLSPPSQKWCDASVIPNDVRYYLPKFLCITANFMLSTPLVLKLFLLFGCFILIAWKVLKYL